MAKNTSWISGQHAVASVMRTSPERILRLYLASSDMARHTDIEAQARRLGIPTQQVEKTDLVRLCGSERHQGIALETMARRELTERDLQSLIEKRAESRELLILVLDQIQDPHNLGACLRSANAMGVDAVIIPKHDSCSLTAVVHKVSVGASFMTPLIVVNNLARCMQKIADAGIWLVG